MNLLNTLPIAIIGAISAILAFDKRYEDGLIRHASLATIVIVAIVIVLGDWSGYYDYHFPVEIKILLWAYNVFFVCHAYSFIRWRVTGSHDWNKKNGDNKQPRA